MKQNTKQKIIEAGAQIIHHKGYNHTGIQEILAAAGVPKGSFYFYFKNKEDFGLQVISYFETVFASMIAPVMDDTTRSPIDKIEGILDFFIDMFQEMNFENGCPIGNLAQEMGDLNPAFSHKLTGAVERMALIYRNLLDEATDTGLIKAKLPTDEMAEFIVSSWHGALIKMKINRDSGPLALHKKMILAMITV